MISDHLQLAEGTRQILNVMTLYSKGLRGCLFFFFSVTPTSKRILALQMLFQKKKTNHYRQQYCSEIIHIFCILFLQLNTLRYSVLHYAFVFCFSHGISCYKLLFGKLCWSLQ